MVNAALPNVSESINPGIYSIANEAYHKGPGISRSGLMELKRSPYHYWYKHINPAYVAKPATPAQLFGHAFHTRVLEPDKFEGVTNVLTSYQKKLFGDLEPMLASLKQNKLAWGLIENAQIEQSLYWNDPDTGILCKCRPDILRQSLVADLKSSNDGSAWTFSKAILDYGYHIQMAMIREAVRIIQGINLQSFWFIVIEKSAPYVVSTYKLDAAALGKGLEEFKSLLQQYKACLAANDWPSYAVQEISLPRYAFN